MRFAAVLFWGRIACALRSPLRAARIVPTVRYATDRADTDNPELLSTAVDADPNGAEPRSGDAALAALAIAARDAEAAVVARATAANIKATPSSSSTSSSLLLPARVAQILTTPEYEVVSALMTVLSCALYALSTLPIFDPELERYLELSQSEFFSIFFAVEYFLRWYSRGYDLRMFVEPISVVDLVSFAPTLLDKLTPAAFPLDLSFLRLLRALRLQRLLVDAETFARFRAAIGFANARAASSKLDRVREDTLLQLARVVTSLFTLLFTASGLIYTAEHEANPLMFPDFFTAAYFGLCTLTTVGFGDIVPITPNGRLVVSGSVLIGIAIIPLQLTGLAESLLRAQNVAAKKNDPRGIRLDRLKTACPECGEKAHRRDAAFCFRCGTPRPDADSD